MGYEWFIFWFWESLKTDWHAWKVKKLPTICLTINFSKLLLCVLLICGDWYDWSYFHFIMPVTADKAAFVSAVLFVYSITGETDIIMLQKQHLVAKNEFSFSFRQR